MRKQLISLIAIFIIVLATAFVFRDTTDKNIKLTASGLDYITAEQNQYELSKEHQAAIKANWQEIKDSWSEFSSQFKDSPVFDFFDELQFGGSKGSFNSNNLSNNLEDYFKGLNF